MGLAEYKRKRDFARTAEPKGKPLPKSVKGASHFVIQKHDASRLHYDFRLEMDGVLKSWAVPKGLPWKQGEKHLAVEVEDHPVEYATFEGIIPRGQYGGGSVMLWDQGKYFVYGENPLESLGKGRLHLVLEGKKAKGEWALIRIRRDGEKNQWLLLKATDSLKPISKKLDDQSVKTGRTMKQIATEQDAEWQSNRKNESPTNKFRARIQAAVVETVRGHKKKDAREGKKVGRAKASSVRTSSRRRTAPNEGKLEGPLEAFSLPAMKPHFIEPMKPKLLETPPGGGDWIYELKFDGIRALAIKREKKLSLLSRNQNELGGRFPEIVAATKELPAREFVIDGEIVALDEKGRSSFQLLQMLEMEGRKAPLLYYVFDILQAEGKNLMPLPLETRKQLLSKLREEAGDPIRFSDELGRDADALLKEIRRLGLEGIVGKQPRSLYEPGRRRGAWIKLKCVNEQEFVIGGYTPPAGSRKYFGALLVGYYDEGKKKGGRLRFAGKVGTGFTEKSLAALYQQFQAERRKDCPFLDLPSKEGGKWVQGITPGEMRKCTWLKPVFVCEVKFAEWTRDNKLRQPVFMGLREDKDPRAVTKEG
jgi:bifunctional non-homologous end joining protein LigD